MPVEESAGTAGLGALTEPKRCPRRGLGLAWLFLYALLELLHALLELRFASQLGSLRLHGACRRGQAPRRTSSFSDMLSSSERLQGAPAGRAVTSLLEDGGRALREERRRFGCARPRCGKTEGVMISRRRLEQGRRMRRTRSERGESVAQLGTVGRLLPGMTVPEMDQAALRIYVLNRMLQSRLPAGKQRRGEQQPRDQCSKISWRGQRR